MKALNAAIGVRAHSGWAAFVVLRGDPGAPDIAARGRMMLHDPANKNTKMLFHAAEPMAFARAEKFVAECRAATAKLARAALKDMLLEHGALAGCCILTASGRPLPDLKSILASHALIHAAEGEFYRDAVAQACERGGVAVRRIRERDIAAEVEHLPCTEESRCEHLAAFGKQLGAPWTRDEKLAALGAWLVLATKPSKR